MLSYLCPSISWPLTVAPSRSLVLSLPHMAFNTHHTQPLPLQCGHSPVHILLLLVADDHMGPILGQVLGNNKANPAGRGGRHSQPYPRFTPS
jgi:hypothetical protein